LLARLAELDEYNAVAENDPSKKNALRRDVVRCANTSEVHT